MEKNQIDLEFIYLKRVKPLSAMRGAYLPAIAGEREREKMRGREYLYLRPSDNKRALNSTFAISWANCLT